MLEATAREAVDSILAARGHEAAVAVLCYLASLCPTCNQPATIRSSKRLGRSRVSYLLCECGWRSKTVVPLQTSDMPTNARVRK